MRKVRSAKRLGLPEDAPLPKFNAAHSAKLAAPRRRGSGLMLALLTVLLMIHISASLLSGEPQVEAPGVAWADLQIDGDLSATLSAAVSPPIQQHIHGPSLIPRIIHHLYNASDPSGSFAASSYVGWRKANPGWELRFYDESESQAYVARWFPQYAAVYSKLRTDRERRDLFRYLAVLRHGGVFADAGAPIPKPLEEILRPEDSMVTAWDAEFPSGQAAVSSCYIRARQLQNRLFAAAPGHPVLREAVERIASTLDTRFSLHPTIDALERTGPGLFTDAVLKHAQAHPPALRRQNSDPFWSIRVLPRKGFGDVPQEPCEQPWDVAMLPEEQDTTKAAKSSFLIGRKSALERVSQQNGGSGPQRPPLEQNHSALGARRLARWWSWAFWWIGGSDTEPNANSWPYSNRPDVAVASHLERLEAAHEDQQLFPVSADFEPPFDVMTHLVSHGERQSGWDVSQVLSTYGAWQPSVQPTRRPSLIEALVGSLGAFGDSTSADSSETVAPSSAAAAGNITLEPQNGVLVDVGAGYGVVSLAAAARGHRVHAFELGPGSLQAFEASIARNGFDSLIQIHKVPLGAESQRGTACLELKEGAMHNAATMSPLPTNPELARGYSDHAAHAVDAALCARSALRIPGTEAIPANERVAAMRISANGWEGFVLEGFLPLIRAQLPPVIAIEWNPVAMKAVGYHSPLAILHMMSQLGYDDISHSGFICDERWYSVTYGVRRKGVKPEDQSSLKQPTWCRLLPEDQVLLLEKANSKYPETLLFINRKSGKNPEEVHSASEGRNSSYSGPGQEMPSSGDGEQQAAQQASESATREAEVNPSQAVRDLSASSSVAVASSEK